MANQPTDPDTPMSSDRGSTYRTPRWVKVLGIVVVILVLLVAVVLDTGIGGEHGPGRHMPSGDTSNGTLPAIVTEEVTSSAGDLSVHTSPIEHSTQQP